MNNFLIPALFLGIPTAQRMREGMFNYATLNGAREEQSMLGAA
jgi:hypothetical protein